MINPSGWLQTITAAMAGTTPQDSFCQNFAPEEPPRTVQSESHVSLFESLRAVDAFMGGYNIKYDRSDAAGEGIMKGEGREFKRRRRYRKGVTNMSTTVSKESKNWDKHHLRRFKRRRDDYMETPSGTHLRLIDATSVFECMGDLRSNNETEDDNQEEHSRLLTDVVCVGGGGGGEGLFIGENGQAISDETRHQKRTNHFSNCHTPPSPEEKQKLSKQTWWPTSTTSGARPLTDEDPFDDDTQTITCEAPEIRESQPLPSLSLSSSSSSSQEYYHYPPQQEQEQEHHHQQHYNQPVYFPNSYGYGYQQSSTSQPCYYMNDWATPAAATVNGWNPGDTSSSSLAACCTFPPALPYITPESYTQAEKSSWDYSKDICPNNTSKLIFLRQYNL